MIKDCDLLDRVNWIKDAVSSKDLVSQLTSFYIHENFLHASDGRMVVGTPFPTDGIGTVLVPAEPFMRVLENRPAGKYTWEREEDRLVLHRGRFKGKVKLLPVDLWPYPLLGNSVGTFRLPDGLVNALRSLLPFVSENATKPWATCLLAKNGSIYASNNVVIAKVELPDTLHGVDEGEEMLIPCWVAEFVVKRQEDLEWWGFDKEAQRILFGWEDGSWMRSSLVSDKFPPVEQALSTMYGFTPPDVEVTDEWRSALRRVAKITGDPVLRLRVDGVYGAGGEAVLVEDDAATPVPDGLTETVWDIRFLESVIDVATHWDPTVYPKPAPWRGSHIHGIIIGRRDT